MFKFDKNSYITNNLDSIHLIDKRFKKIITAGHTTTLNATISDLNDSSNINFMPLDTATTLNISSTSIEDAPGGTGISYIAIIGLDQNFDEITEFIFLNGTNIVSTVNSYRTLNVSVAVLGGTPGSGAAGIITLIGTPGSGGDIFGRYIVNDTTCEVGRYTVPNGYKFLGLNLTTSGGKNVDATFKLMIDLPGRLSISSGEIYPSQGMFSITNITPNFLNGGESFRCRGYYNSGGSGVRYMSVVVSGVIAKASVWDSFLL